MDKGPPVQPPWLMFGLGPFEDQDFFWCAFSSRSCWCGSDIEKTETEALMPAVASLKQANWTTQSVLIVPGFAPDFERDATLAPLGITAEEIKKAKLRFTVPLATYRCQTKKLEADGADDHMCVS